MGTPLPQGAADLPAALPEHGAGRPQTKDGAAWEIYRSSWCQLRGSRGSA
jgi:hypothetical protein